MGRQGIHLSEEVVDQMFELRDSGLNQSEIAARLEVSTGTVSKRLRGMTASPSRRVVPGPIRHSLTDVREPEARGTCAKCGPETRIKFRRERDQWVCYEAILSHRKPGTNSDRRRLGVNEARYAEMMNDQGGVCAICGGVNPNGNTLSVDHCHRTGQVRGLLCQRCNSSLGHFLDDVARLERAISYLIDPPVQLPGRNGGRQSETAA